MERRKDYKRTLGGSAWKALARETEQGEDEFEKREFIERMRARIYETKRALEKKADIS